MQIGVDIIERWRWQALSNEARALEFVLTPTEHTAWATRPDYWGFGASRLAVKEAVIKALPVSANYHDFSIETNGRGLIFVAQKKSLQKYKVAVSVAHSTDTVIGMACCT